MKYREWELRGIEPDAYTRRAMQNMNSFKWKLTWTFWPRRSYTSNKRMGWFQTAYKGIKIIDGPGESILFVRWLSSEEYLFEKIKGTIV